MKAIMVALLACVLVPAMALAQEGQAQGTLNTITGVNVTGGRVEIVGTKKPNFTTFTMTDPPRLVIDISEAVFSGVREEITVGNGTITGIRTASYGSDESAIARVLIGYEREVETDIQAAGNALVVSVAGSGGAAVAQRPAAVPGTAPDAGATAPNVTATEAAAAAGAERQQQEKAAAQAAAAARTDTEAQRQAQARAEADRKAQEEATRAAAQQAEQRRLQDERAAKEAAVAAEKQRQQADERTRREAEAQATADARKRQQEEARASAEERKRQASEEREARRDAARAAAEKQRQQAEERQARLAQAETPRRAPEQGDGAGVSSHGKTMTLVGFKQEPTGSRVFVRTNEPVRYTVTEGDKEVVLELENTRIAETNNSRSMNTSFFDTPVASVDADAGPSRTVRVAIKLKEQVAYRTRQEGNEVSIEFQRSSRH